MGCSGSKDPKPGSKAALALEAKKAADEEARIKEQERLEQMAKEEAKRLHEEHLHQMCLPPLPTVDRYAEFIENGGSLSKIIQSYEVPKDWNKLQCVEYPIGIFKAERNGEACVTATIHLNDDLPGVKRHFLAFFDLQMLNISPEQFSEWCRGMDMHNTLGQYLPLYYLSKYTGQGSLILRSIYNTPDALGIEVSDRFQTGKGFRRALRFIATNKWHAVQMVNNYLASINPLITKSAIIPESFPALDLHLTFPVEKVA